MSKCSICNKLIEREDAPILVMGAYGNPKYLCDECAAELDEATLGREVDKIAATMENIGKKMSDSNPDKLTYTTVSGIMESAAERASRIKAGTYDFAEDTETDVSDDTFEEIPEELMETEEDRALDKKDEEQTARFNKFMDYVNIGVIIGAVGSVIFFILKRFVF